MATKKKPTISEVMVVNDVPGEECRIAILEDGHLEEIYAEQTESATNVGNIYKGRVMNVEPAIQAAFIDYGAGVNGFLHISDLHPRYFPGAERTERVGKKIPRRERPLIQEALRRGDEVLVQVLKQGIGTKGPTLTSYLSIPGRLLVMMPDMDRVGVSRKVEDEEKRREMRRILDSLDLPEGFGFILRTAGFDRNKTELKRDVAYLTRLWKVMDKRIKTVNAPCPLYQESDLLIRTVRDVLRPAIRAIIVDSPSTHERVSTFLEVVAPRSAPPVVLFRRSTPIFHAFDVERQIDLIHAREVPLPSGGRLVFDQTEALVAIDVNSGRSRRARDSETNAYHTNCEAVDEICRQLRLRDLGGLIIHDLIDMRIPRHRRQIEERFREAMKRDRARSTILRISDFGLVEMTRQRMRPSLRTVHFGQCPRCDGRGEIKERDSIAADVMREIGYLLAQSRVRRVEVACAPRVAASLLSRKRRELVQLEDRSSKTVYIRVSEDIAPERVDYYAYDERGADLKIDQLPRAKSPTLEELHAEADAPMEEEAAPTGRRRRRRRRGSQVADATAIALQGGFDDDQDDADEVADEPETDVARTDDEAAPPRKKRRRRRRRKSGGGEAEASPETMDGEAATDDAPVETAPVPKGIELPETTQRVHQLAKILEVPSRDIVERCREDGRIEMKNHMSSVSPENAKIIAEMFGVAVASAEPEVIEEAPAASDTDQAESGTKRRRRRRRGGRRRSRSSAGADDRPADTSAGDGTSRHSEERSEDRSDDRADEHSDDEHPDDEWTDTEPSADGEGTRKKRRRRRRRSRGATDETAETPATDSPEVAASAASDDSATDAEGPPKRKRRSRSKAAAETTDGDAPVSGGDEPAVDEKPAKPRRRVLYRNRTPVSPAAREALESIDGA